jgi:excisionase family DNA binding protein
MERYTTISGEVVEYETPAPHVVAFLARVVDATHDPSVSDAALTDLIYGKDNPILRQDILPNQGVVTREVFADPLYRVMTDLLGRKRAQRGVRPTAPRAGLTVKEVAAKHGVHESAIRQAIEAGRLRATKHGSSYVIADEDAESFQPARRGPKPRRVEIRMGSSPGASLSVRVLGGDLVEDGRRGRVISGHVRADENELRFGDFFVRGHFAIEEKENNPRQARERWSEYEELA